MPRADHETSAAFFDLDKTIIATSSTLAFARPFYTGGLLTRGDLVRSAYAQLVYAVNGADHDQLEKMKEYVSTLCAGWDVETVRDIVGHTLEDLIVPLVFAEATALIDQHHAEGRDVVVISASGREMVEPIAKLVGADHVVSTRMRELDGRYTGEIDFYAYGPHKAEAMREMADTHGYDLATSYAYSDSMTDVPMLELVGFPSVVNPDRTLRRIATERAWPILDFAAPNRSAPRLSRSRAATTSRTEAADAADVAKLPGQRTAGSRALGAAATAATAGATAAAGIVWYANRRRDRSLV